MKTINKKDLMYEYIKWNEGIYPNMIFDLYKNEIDHSFIRVAEMRKLKLLDHNNYHTHLYNKIKDEYENNKR